MLPRVLLSQSHVAAVAEQRVLGPLLQQLLAPLQSSVSSQWPPLQQQQQPQMHPHALLHSPLQQQRGAATKKAGGGKKAQPNVKGGRKGGAAAPKKQKQKMEAKAFDEKDPLLQKLVAMLVPAAEPQPRSAADQTELVARAREFSRLRMAEHKAWKADLNARLALKKSALAALPPDLRAAAAQEDLAPFPLTRHYLYDAPPDAYKE